MAYCPDHGTYNEKTISGCPTCEWTRMSAVDRPTTIHVGCPSCAALRAELEEANAKLCRARADIESTVNIFDMAPDEFKELPDPVGIIRKWLDENQPTSCYHERQAAVWFKKWNEEVDSTLSTHSENQRLREYIAHLETCSRCNKGFCQICDERDELRHRVFGEGT